MSCRGDQRRRHAQGSRPIFSVHPQGPDFTCSQWQQADWLILLCVQAERQRLANIPGMLNPNEQQEEMRDA